MSYAQNIVICSLFGVENKMSIMSGSARTSLCSNPNIILESEKTIHRQNQQCINLTM